MTPERSERPRIQLPPLSFPERSPQTASRRALRPTSKLPHVHPWWRLSSTAQRPGGRIAAWTCPQLSCDNDSQRPIIHRLPPRTPGTDAASDGDPRGKHIGLPPGDHQYKAPRSPWTDPWGDLSDSEDVTVVRAGYEGLVAGGSRRPEEVLGNTSNDCSLLYSLFLSFFTFTLHK